MPSVKGLSDRDRFERTLNITGTVLFGRAINRRLGFESTDMLPSACTVVRTLRMCMLDIHKGALVNTTTTPRQALMRIHTSGWSLKKDRGPESYPELVKYGNVYTK